MRACWWRKSHLESSASQQAIDELAASLEHRREDRQREAAQQLAAIGHPLAVRWSLKYLTKNESAEWGVRLLEQIVNDFTQTLEADCLREIATLANPLQRIPTPPTARGERRIPSTWAAYRTIDCSELRRIAEQELKRRAPSPWRGDSIGAKVEEGLEHSRVIVL